MVVRYGSTPTTQIGQRGIGGTWSRTWRFDLRGARHKQTRLDTAALHRSFLPATIAMSLLVLSGDASEGILSDDIPSRIKSRNESEGSEGESEYDDGANNEEDELISDSGREQEAGPSGSQMSPGKLL